ncbi:serpin family protein [Bacteroidota bacterium]
MKRSLFIVFLAISLVSLLNSCKSQKKSTEESSPSTSGFNSESLAGASNQFAIDLFKQLQEKSDNLVYSPYSISTVLAMTYSGAEGQTAQEMREVLYFPPANQLDPAEKDLNERILSNDTLDGIEISLANAIWAQENFHFLPEYMEKIKKWYDAPLTKMNFINEQSREENRLKINQWVLDNTGQKIRNLIGEGVLNTNTRMVLTNAVYFNGSWMWPFNKHLTSPSLFHINSKESINTDFMHLTKTLDYYEDEEIQAIRLPYKNERISMMIILPGSVEGWELVSRVLDLEKLSLVEAQLTPKEVYVSMPKFSSELQFNLRKELSGMGMEKAFSRDADFSGMTGEKNLFIDEVVHKAFIEVSESGTKAAAATSAIMGLKSALIEDPERFNADHPFLYLIKDHQTGCIIFLGRLVKPS